jgi:hypothetical protein
MATAVVTKFWSAGPWAASPRAGLVSWRDALGVHQDPLGAVDLLDLAGAGPGVRRHRCLFSWGQTQRLLRFEDGTTFRGGKVPAGFAEHIANEIRSQAASISLFGLLIGQLIIIVLGALAITSEYSTGMIRTSLTAMPRRGTVFAAKGVVFGRPIVGRSLPFVFVSHILSTQHVNTTLSHPNVPDRVAGPVPGGAVCRSGSARYSGTAGSSPPPSL